MLLAVLAVICIAVSCSVKDDWLNVLIVLHSAGELLKMFYLSTITKKCDVFGPVSFSNLKVIKIFE